MQTTATAIPAATVANLRDLGGITLADGRRVAPGMLFRSGQFSRFDPTADPHVAALGLRTVVDLRTAEERGAEPDRVPGTARLLCEDVLGEDPDVAPARLHALLADPGRAERELGGGRAAEVFAVTYRRMVLSGRARAAYRALVEAVADARPVLFHCTAGKDRTGWGAALLLMLLGAERAVVRDEFLAVNPAVRAGFAPFRAQFTAAGGDPGIADAIIEVHGSYLDAALDAMDAEWGGVSAYVREGLGVSDATVERVCAELAVPAWR
ncbi:tyrosine-protein phosphatase [Yinghuangia sp. YIM S09857]|uniref:tyrosine-protein phosphatase n=1 Tax=Yinghuangia sp. YIM S09857 TaxID=3436929 RepID=UPI003F52E5DB